MPEKETCDKVDGSVDVREEAISVRFAQESVNSSSEYSSKDRGATNEASAHRRIDFVHEHRSGVNVYDHYEHLKLLGIGAFSKVVLVKKKTSRIRKSNKDTKKSFFSSLFSCLEVDEDNYVLETKPQPVQYFALKMIDTSRVDASYMDALRNEINLFKSMDHPNIIKAYETFERRNELSIIMEYATGGDLYARRPYTETQCIRIIKKLLSAVAYMHNHNIMHRDLKFENIMFESKKALAEIKVIDFGLSTKFLNPFYIMRDKVGTLSTVAPDVVRESYTVKADMWSVGVITYMLLTGQQLFHGKTKREFEKEILSFKWSQFKEHSSLEGVSSDAKDFLQNLLEQSPSKRFSAAQAQKHSWLISNTKQTDFQPSKSIRAAVHDYANSAELKKLALQVIAYQTRTDQTKKLRRAFSIVDTTKSGEITYDEFQAAFRQSGVVSDVDVEKLFDKIDFKKEKKIDYTEFVAATIESQGIIEESRIAEAFERFDTEHTGKISKENLRAILDGIESDEYVDSLLQEADNDGDGIVNYDDFRRLFVEKKKDEIRESMLMKNFQVMDLLEEVNEDES